VENPTQNQNKWAHSAIWLGIASIVFFWMFVPPILAIVYGSLGISRSTELQNEGIDKTGKGKAIAGLILGIVYLLLGFYQWMR
jgi:hypothetical protein